MFSVIKLPQLKNIIIINRSIYINEVEIKTRQKTPTHFKYRYKKLTFTRSILKYILIRNVNLYYVHGRMNKKIRKVRSIFSWFYTYIL